MSGEGLSPNLVLLARREARGWGRGRLAAEMRRVGAAAGLTGLPSSESMAKSIYRHETGRSQAVKDPLYRQLYCLVYGASPHDIFGSLGANASDQRESLTLTSHKFVPVHLGRAAPALVDVLEMQEADDERGPHFVSDLRLDADAGYDAIRCELWPHGVAVFDLVQDLDVPDLASLASWRGASYPQDRAAVARLVEPAAGDCFPAYVFSLYWVHSVPWAADQALTGLRLLSMPRVLLRREIGGEGGHAQLVERALLAEGFDHEGIECFGVAGISNAYASWSSVVYHPLAPNRSLLESEVVAYEMALQSTWAYCDHINQTFEQGQDPDVPMQYGRRFLRGQRSRLANPRADESGQHRAMRTAVLSTSSIESLIDHAVEALRD